MPDALTDELEIRDLIARFTDAVNRGAPADLAALFTEDGEWHVPGMPVATGRDAIEALLGTLIGSFDRLVQLLHSGHVDLDGDRAVATWYLTELTASTSAEKAFHFVGVYADQVVRTAEGWRFAQRSFEFLYRAKGDTDARRYPHPALR